jgi:ABC-type dipeptide/oligopeptide/nickel transport system permease component
MIAFLLRRLGQSLVLLLIVSMIGFAILHLAQYQWPMFQVFCLALMFG